MNTWSESGKDVFNPEKVLDAGDIPDVDGEGGFERVTGAVFTIISKNNRLLALGGDHAVTYLVLKAVAGYHGPVTLIHLDAHPDLYDVYDGDRLSHACTMARVMEERLVGRLIQVGIRASNDHQRDQAKRFGVETYEMKSLQKMQILSLEAPVYLTLDMDVLDPAYAPGVSHFEPGGMSTRGLISFIQSLPSLVGADIVEYNPERDPSGVTAMVAVKLMKELIGRML
jgi:agmatinase